MGEVTIAAGDPAAPGVAALLEAHEREMNLRYGGPGEPSGKDPTIPAQFTPAEGGTFLVARHQGTIAGIAGMRIYEHRVGEIKRMYVIPGSRGRGIGRRLLAALETWAVENGLSRIILETGTAQPEACALYESAGFTPIVPYGVWKDSPDSICYEKAVPGG